DRVIERGPIGQGRLLPRGRDRVDRVEWARLGGDGRLMRDVVAVIEGEGVGPDISGADLRLRPDGRDEQGAETQNDCPTEPWMAHGPQPSRDENLPLDP